MKDNHLNAMFVFDIMQTIYLIRGKAQLKKDGSTQIMR